MRREEEGIELIKEMKQRFSAVVEAGTSKFMIQNTENSSLELDVSPTIPLSRSC